MKTFSIGDSIFVCRYNNNSLYNDNPSVVRLDRNNLINHWRGKYLRQYFVIDGEKIEYHGFGNCGSPFSTIVRLDEDNAIIVSDSITVAKARIKLEYNRAHKKWLKKLRTVLVIE